ESFEKWGKQEVLSDVVRVIRMFRPDVIITRFAPDRSAGHGHHEASAILAEEAFDLAGDPKAFPEHLKQGLEVWQPRRLFFNGSTWWKKDLAEIAKNDPDWFSVDVGGYDPLLGLSYTEIAGRSRSMHKSQGFGAAETRGESLEYLKLIKGDRPKTEDIFEGIDMTWGRIPNGTRIGKSITSLCDSYSTSNPEKSGKAIRDLRQLLRGEVNDPWVKRTYDQLGYMYASINGIALDLTTSSFYLCEEDTLKYDATGILRNTQGLTGPIPVTFGRTSFSYLPWDGKAVVADWILPPPNSVDMPYWLKERRGNLNLVESSSLIGLARLKNALDLDFELSIVGEEVPYTLPVLYKWVDRVAGERIRPVYVTPVASVIPKTDVLIARGGPQLVSVEVEALTDTLRGELTVTAPPGWLMAGSTSSTLSMGVTINKRGEKNSFSVRVDATAEAIPGALKFAFVGPKGTADRTLHEIDYPHIMPQVYYTPAEVKLVPLDVKTTAKRVGYVKGAGDDVPQAMEQLGVAVEFIDLESRGSTGSPRQISLEELKKYDAIVTGIRAYNTTKGMKELHPFLLQYVEEGGTLIVQYNTTPRFFSGASDFQIDPATLGPHPFTIGRGRVTVEEAPPTFLDPKHPLLNMPNTITAADFEGWVQERGLYFATDFGTNYTPLIAWNDPGEEPLNGALIVADHGKGRFIYTGISFFRQLPAGVPGAYRLFANLISPRTAR
ncbi:MAG: hypothetical protein JNM31_07000, partial [Flavobacteriales bacterium]|nr:hypothetical protein [Flavobacteriales bacterium]